MRHLTRAQARALTRAHRDNARKQKFQEDIDQLLEVIMEIEKRVVKVEDPGPRNKQRCLPMRDAWRHSELVSKLIEICKEIEASSWCVWSFFEFNLDNDDEAEMAHLVAELVAPHLASMSTAHRRHKYARA